MLHNAIETWNSVYANHAALRTGLGFLHVAGLIVGGGSAVVADRGTLAAARLDPAIRAAQLHRLTNTHRAVLAGLAAVVASGVLLFAADLDTYLYSTVFWGKMALLALLFANGAVLVAAGRRAERGEALGWQRLARASAASLVLWFLVTLAGAALPNVG
jgi:uncharacterized membrane protein